MKILQSFIPQFTVKLESETKKEFLDFVKTNHYSKSTGRNFNHLFTLWFGNKLLGCAILGIPVGSNCQAKYSISGAPIIELRRLCLIPGVPTNTASFFIGHILRYLKKHTNYDGVLSYADSGQMHTGTIYQATNFEYYGIEPSNNSEYRIKNTSKWYHSRVKFQYGTDTSKKLIKAEKEGKLIRRTVFPKHTYYFNLRK